MKDMGKNHNPDRGPPMMEGAHHFNKGYTSDDEYFDPHYGKDHERGNDYMPMQNERCHKDTKKIERSKFSKIA